MTICSLSLSHVTILGSENYNDDVLSLQSTLRELEKKIQVGIGRHLHLRIIKSIEIF